MKRVKECVGVWIKHTSGGAKGSVKARITDPVFLEGCHMNPTSTWRNYDPHLKTVHQHNCDFTSILSLLLHVVSNWVPWLRGRESETEWGVLTMRQNINTWSSSTKSKASVTDCINTLLCIRALPLPPISGRLGCRWLYMVLTFRVVNGCPSNYERQRHSV